MSLKPEDIPAHVNAILDSVVDIMVDVERKMERAVRAMREVTDTRPSEDEAIIELLQSVIEDRAAARLVNEAQDALINDISGHD